MESSPSRGAPIDASASRVVAAAIKQLNSAPRNFLNNNVSPHARAAILYRLF